MLVFCLFALRAEKTTDEERCEPNGGYGSTAIVMCGDTISAQHRFVEHRTLLGSEYDFDRLAVVTVTRRGTQIVLLNVPCVF